MKRRKFADAISVLNAKREIYEDSFDYSYTLGLAFLYAGDTGSAAQNFESARKCRLNDANLLLAQAAIFLRRGDTERAVQYYLDILDLEPDNPDAKRALEFVRTHGDYEEICRWVDDGRIERYYPRLGVNPDQIRRLVLSLLLGALCGLAAVHFWPRNNFAKDGRADISCLMLSASESSSPVETGSSPAFKYELSAREVNAAYNSAADLFQHYRDNAAQKEINLILNSNASAAVKRKARELAGYFTVPGFDSLHDNYSYAEVAKAPELYIDCYVDWSGRISNTELGTASYSCDLLVGYENIRNVEGIVRVYFDFLPVPAINCEKPVRILGRITTDGAKLSLRGRSVYQSVEPF